MKIDKISVLLIVLFGLWGPAKSNELKFEQFSLNNKLPSNSVVRIYNDNEGFIWFGTKDGLCRFDGYDIKVFRSSAITPGKLVSNEIQCMAEDKTGKLWVGTLEGVEILDKHNYSITHFQNEFTNKERINSIMVDRKGYIWIGTSNYGILKVNPDNNEYERFSTDRNSSVELPDNNVNFIFEDSNDRIWVLLWRGGLCYIDSKNNKVINLPQIGANNNPFRLLEDRDGLFWICTWGDGVYNLKIHNNRINIEPVVVSGKSDTKIDDIVYSITQDDTGRIWLVTFSGLKTLTKDIDGTYVVSGADKFFEGEPYKLLHQIVKDRSGNLWLGSVGTGALKLNFNKLPIKNYSLLDVSNSTNANAYVTHFTQTRSGDLFLSLNRVGLFMLDLNSSITKRPNLPVLRRLNSISALKYIEKTDEIWLADEGEDIIYVFEDNKGELKLKDYFSLRNTKTPFENTIVTLFEDKKSNVWIGTAKGLYMKKTGGPVELISDKLQNIVSIGQDINENIWVGTGKEGAFVSNAVGNKYEFIKIPLVIDKYQSVSVQSICCPDEGGVFIGTREGCIFQYDASKNIATDISGLYGITEEGILDILSDSFGNLWISTVKKIIRYNPETHAATYFTTNDGLLISSMYKDASIKLNDGVILFGGNNGISIFNKNDQKNNRNQAVRKTVAITDLLIQNKSIFDDQEHKHFDSLHKKLVLKYNENNLSIEFSALDYNAAGKIQYAYKLSGADKDWNYVGNTRRFVNYVNMAPGTYTFMVKASDENGAWSNAVTTLKIEIMPPLYRSWLAYLIYLVLIAIIANIIYRTVSNRIRLRNELKISKIEKDKSEELAQVKLRYFTNISHELLTPLTIIMLQIESLQNKFKTEAGQFDLMKDNVIRLKRLIQQILVFRKTESGNMKLKIQKDDIVGFVNNICQSNFKPLINEKSIKFSVDSGAQIRIAFFDPDKLDKVIYNILSNAFKYTPRNGEIKVKMSFIERDGAEVMRLSVSDTGKGIATEDLPNIFQRFYISKASDQSQSHGIGLSLTHDLIQLHKGSIDVKSEVGVGSVFTIEIPVSENAYTSEELSDETNEKLIFPDIDDIVTDDLEVQENEEADENQVKEFAVLIVEDNKELNNLIVENLGKKYHVLSAENGLQALEIIKDKEIDLIISDVMMPEMDGLSFCKVVKNDVNTSHISVLMLTAKNTPEDRIECYNAGADAYIAKPFELGVLTARVRNLLNKRKKKTEDFKSNPEINITSMEYCSIDEIFLNQAVKVVENRIADERFDFDQFAVEMATSKSTLHRKLKSLTGLSPGEFIRNVRLKHAVQMLKNNVGNISEVAFSVGFNDPKYFSRCFKIEFGMTPKEFQEEYKTK
ncbi:MAG: two-component regulator propeller domain-containing protein [Paludibacter sp.]|nr:two-component regulator propeller domain-containing protein [Paludibacter sp.]